MTKTRRHRTTRTGGKKKKRKFAVSKISRTTPHYRSYRSINRHYSIRVHENNTNFKTNTRIFFDIYVKKKKKPRVFTAHLGGCRMEGRVNLSENLCVCVCVHDDDDDGVSRSGAVGVTSCTGRG